MSENVSLGRLLRSRSSFKVRSSRSTSMVSRCISSRTVFCLSSMPEPFFLRISSWYSRSSLAFSWVR